MRFIKEKTLPKTTPIKEKKHGSLRLFRTLFVGLTTYLIISGPLALHKITMVQNQIEHEQTVLTKSIQDQLQPSETNKSVSSELFKQFLQPFIQVYFTVPQDQQAFEKRTQVLQEKYSSIDWSSEKNTGIERKVLSNEFYQLLQIDGQKIGVYRIHYELVSPIVKEREVKQKQGAKEVIKKEKYTDYITSTKNILINVPFQVLDNGTFQLTAYPFFSTEKPLNGTEAKKQTLDYSNFTPVKKEQSEAMDTFVHIFLQKYVSASIDDMSYLMKEPEILSDEYTVQDIQTESYTTGKHLIVFVTFDLVDKETTASHKEEMTLLLKQRDTTFYVEKLTHFRGGINNETN